MCMHPHTKDTNMPEYTLHDYDDTEAKHPASAGCHPTTCSRIPSGWRLGYYRGVRWEAWADHVKAGGGNGPADPEWEWTDHVNAPNETMTTAKAENIGVPKGNVWAVVPYSANADVEARR
jgi:hypothetical protein